MCSWQEDVDEEAKGERQKEARPAKNHVLDHRGLGGPCQVLERMDGHGFPTHKGIHSWGRVLTQGRQA